MDEILVSEKYSQKNIFECSTIEGASSLEIHGVMPSIKAPTPDREGGGSNDRYDMKPNTTPSSKLNPVEIEFHILY